MEIVEIGRLTAIQRLELEGGESDPFDVASLGPLDSRRKEIHMVLPGDDGRLVASVGMLTAEVQVGGADRFEVVGIGGVIVAPDHRGRGLVRSVLSAALQRAATLGPDLAMLFCHERLAGLYEKAGFLTIPPPVRVLQETRIIEMPQQAMWRGLHDGAQWPAGELLVLSLPF